MSIEDEVAVVERQTLSEVRSFLDNDEPGKVDIVKAKVAVTMFSAIVRRQQTQSARDALRWAQAQTLLDKDRLREYTRMSQPPGSPLVLALPEPNGKE